MNIIPLQYLSATITAGESRTAADASTSAFATNQQAVRLGEPIPIVFCRRQNSNGGVFVQPKASEVRFNGIARVIVDGVQTVPASIEATYVLVLSDGELPAVFLKDCFLGSARTGTWNQSYDRKPNAAIPGSFGTQHISLPEHCGTSGSYEGITTLSVYKNHLRFDDFGLSANVFVREGIKVTRLIDSTLGPSDNVADLMIYLMQQSKEVPNSLIDTAQMTVAANFVNANSFLFNGQVSKAANLIDWMQETATGFLCKVVKRQGKFGLKPLVEYASDYTVSDKKVNWLYTFMEKHLAENGVEISYVSAEDRKPINFEVLWRQQPDNDIGYIRSSVIKMQGASAQIQTIDLSAFCTSETHAAKVAAYSVAVRKYVTHHVTLNLRPGDYSVHLIVGDVVRLRLRNETKDGEAAPHDHLYQIQSITTPPNGTTVLNLMHYPLNDQGQSLLSLAVKNAVASNNNYDIVRVSDVTDTNPSTGTTTLTDTGLDFDDMLTDDDYDVFDEPDLTTEVEEVDVFVGPFPINSDGDEVSVEGFDDIYDVDADETFDEETQPVVDRDDFDIETINPEDVAAELAPGVSRCGVNTKLDREEQEITNVDEDGNPTTEETVSPFAYPWQRWPNVSSSQSSKKFDTPIENKKNQLRLVTINTSTMLNLKSSQRPFGSSTRVWYYRVEENGDKTYLDKTEGSYSTTYPATGSAGGGFTYAPADVGRPIEVRLVNLSDTSESVYYATLPPCTESAISYDWLKVKLEINESSDVEFSGYFSGSNYGDIEGIHPQKAKEGWNSYEIGEGRLNPDEGEQAGAMVNALVRINQPTFASYQVFMDFNLNAYQVAFPSLKPIVFDLFPIFVAANNDYPTGFTLTATATFYKGTWEGEAITGWPLISSNQVLNQSTTYDVTAMGDPIAGTTRKFLVTNAPNKFRLTIDPDSNSVTFT